MAAPKSAERCPRYFRDLCSLQFRHRLWSTARTDTDRRHQRIGGAVRGLGGGTYFGVAAYELTSRLHALLAQDDDCETRIRELLRLVEEAISAGDALLERLQADRGAVAARRLFAGRPRLRAWLDVVSRRLRRAAPCSQRFGCRCELCLAKAEDERERAAAFAEIDAPVLQWFEHSLPKCLALVPEKFRECFASGVYVRFRDQATHGRIQCEPAPDMSLIDVAEYLELPERHRPDERRAAVMRLVRVLGLPCRSSGTSTEPLDTQRVFLRREVEAWRRQREPGTDTDS